MKLNYLTWKANARIIPILLILILIFSLFCTTTVNACGHTVGTFDDDYTTPKTTFILGETVYGKGTKNINGHLKLRIRDPDNNVVFNSNPVNGKQVTCLWDLDEDAPFGVWNIQIGEFYNGSWNWATNPERIAYFNVIDPTEYNLLINIIGIGTVTKTPDQENYINETVVELAANPDSGYIFDHWEGDVDNNIENPTTINMNSNKTIVVYFKKKSSNSENNNGGESSEKTKNVYTGSTEIENLPPIADLSSGETFQGFNSSEIIFNGSKSYDPDGYISSWIWNFGDGSKGQGKITTHNYSNAGTYTVTLIVTDDKGATNMSECLVLITQPNRPQSNPVNAPIDNQTTPSSEIQVVKGLPEPELGSLSPLILLIVALILSILLFIYIKRKKK